MQEYVITYYLVSMALLPIIPRILIEVCGLFISVRVTGLSNSQVYKIDSQVVIHQFNCQNNLGLECFMPKLPFQNYLFPIEN